MKRCPCGEPLTEKDKERNARDYGGSLVCYDCYARLCEDAWNDELAERAYAEMVEAGEFMPVPDLPYEPDERDILF